MKPNFLRGVFAAFTLVAFACDARCAPAAQGTPASANPKAAEAPEWAELFGGASLPVVWQSTSAASDKIAAALGANALAGVAEWAETIHVGCHALEDQVKVADIERAKRLAGALRQAAKIADDVMESASHHEAEKAAADYQRLKSALALIRMRLPKQIVEAEPQEVRFAKPAGR